jgi:hypothetical protein
MQDSIGLRIAESVLVLVLAYVAAGVVFAAAFLSRGMTRIDPAARGSGWSFRVLILPGVVLLWPLLAIKWRRCRGQSVQGSRS